MALEYFCDNPKCINHIQVTWSVIRRGVLQRQAFSDMERSFYCSDPTPPGPIKAEGDMLKFTRHRYRTTANRTIYFCEICHNTSKLIWEDE